MTTPRRREPLRAQRDVDEHLAVVPIEAAPPPPATASSDGNGHASRRHQALAEGIRRIRVGGGTLNLGERTLMVLGGIIAPLGLVLVILGWYGAAHTPYLVEQIPYVASGGLLGLGLIFLGSFFYFAHWMTEMVKEHRTQSAAVIEAITRLEETVRTTAAHSGGASAAPADGDVVLVATGKGTMAHRPECVVVAGKPDLRRVAAEEGLLPCKLCDPYADALTG